MSGNSVTRRRFLGGLAAVAGAGIVTVGCSSAATQATTAVAGSTATATTTAASAVAATSPRAVSASTVSTSTASTSVSAAASAAPNSWAAQVTLNWWPGWPGTYMQDIANAFMQENPTIKVAAGLFYPNNDKLLTQLASGTGPDLASDILYYNYMARGLLLPIDDLLQTAKISTKDGDVGAPSWNAFRWRGKYYGVPCVDTGGEALGYNVDLVQEAGLDPDQPPLTWDETFLWHQKLTKIDSSGNVQSLGLDPLFQRGSDAQAGAPWLWPEMWGFRYFDANTMKYDIDRAETADFSTVIQKFYDVLGYAKQEAFLKSFTGKNGAFGAGKQAMAIVFSSTAAQVHQTNPNSTYRWTWVPMPTNRKGITLQTAAGHAQVLLQGTKHQEEAFKLALYMTGKKVLDILFEQVGWVGPNKAWQQTMDLSKFPAEVQQSIRFWVTSTDQAHEIWTPDMDPESGYLQTQWGKTAAQINQHQLDPKSAAQQLQFAMTTQLQSQASEFKGG